MYTTDDQFFLESQARLRAKWAEGVEQTKQIEYKYDEDEAMSEIQEYIDNTYSQHYAQAGIQATEFIIDSGHGEGFCIGNVLKYAQRYGRKDGKNRKDLLKVIHYAIVALSINSNEKEPK